MKGLVLVPLSINRGPALIFYSWYFLFKILQCLDEDSSSHDSGHDYEHGSSTTPGGGGANGDLFQCPRNSSDDEDGERSSVDEGIDIDSQHSSSSNKRRKSNSNSSWILTNEDEAIKQFLKVLRPAWCELLVWCPALLSVQFPLLVFPFTCVSIFFGLIISLKLTKTKNN